MGMFMHRRKVAAHKAESNMSEQPKIEAKKEDTKEESDITRDDVAKLPYFKLKSLAKSYGIDVEDKKADVLRTELIEKMEH